MNSIFNGSIVGSVWHDGLEQLLNYWLTGRLPSPWSADPLDRIGSDVFQPEFLPMRPLPVVTLAHGNPHRLQRDFLLHQAGLPPRTVRVSSTNGLLGNVAVINRLPVNSQPVAGPCLIWRGSISGTKHGSDGGYAQFGGKALHRLMYEESRGERLATEDKVLHLCHRRACIQPSHLYLGSDADNAEDRARRFASRTYRTYQTERGHWSKSSAPRFTATLIDYNWSSRGLTKSIPGRGMARTTPSWRSRRLKPRRPPVFWFTSVYLVHGLGPYTFARSATDAR